MELDLFINIAKHSVKFSAGLWSFVFKPLPQQLHMSIGHSHHDSSIPSNDEAAISSSSVSLESSYMFQKEQ